MALVLAACSSANLASSTSLTTVTTPTAGAPELDGTEWVLLTINGSPPIAGSHITLAFLDGQVSGYSGCNWYHSETSHGYSATNGILTVPILEITARGCPNADITRQEQDYHAVLKNGASDRRTGDRLVIGNSSNASTLVFRLRPSLPMDPQKLVGTRWQLRSVGGHSLSPGSVQTLIFENGTVSGSAGCRAYRATYQAKGDRIRFLTLEMIDAGCDMTKLGDEYVADLGTATHYRLSPQELEIETDDYGSFLFDPLPAQIIVTPIPSVSPVPTLNPDWAIFEFAGLRFELDAKGRVVSLVELNTGVNHARTLAEGYPFPFVSAVSGNRSLYPVRMTHEASQQGVLLTLTLDSDSGPVVHLLAENSGRALVFLVKDVQGPPVNELKLLQLPVNIGQEKTVAERGLGLGTELFGVYLLPLDSKTRIRAEVGPEGGTVAVESAPPQQLVGARVAMFAGSADDASSIAKSLLGVAAVPTLQPPSTVVSPNGEWTATTMFEGPYVVVGDQEKYHVLLSVANRQGTTQWKIVDEVRDYGLGYDFPAIIQWSKDGKYVYFTNYPVPDGCVAFLNGSDLHRVDLATGRVQQILPGGSWWLSLSPDESQVAHISWDGASLVLAFHNIATGRERSPKLDAVGENLQAGNIVWSPDEKAVLLAVANHPCDLPNWAHSIIRVDTTSLKQQTLIRDDKRQFAIMDWPEPDRAVLLDKDHKSWWIDTLTGALSQKE